MLTTATYLLIIVAANLVVAHYGPSASVLTAFLAIGATLTLRDRLHDRWRRRQLAVRMAGLIAAGGLLSWAVNAGAGRIALASMLAFAASETVDALLYARLERFPWLQRSNGSNVVSAAVDSLIFPLVAFGALLPAIIVGQWLAKTAGGALWSWILRRPQLAVGAAALLLAAGPARAQQAAPPRFVVQAQAGTNLYQFRDYRPIPNAGLNTILFLPKGFSLLTVISRDIEPRSAWVGVVALQYRIWGW